MTDDMPLLLGEVRAMARAAHSRLDRHEGDVKDRLEKIDTKVAAILEIIHTDKGSRTAIVWLASGVVALVGSGVSAIVTYYLTKG